VNEYETYIKMDTLANNDSVTLTVNSNLTAGAKLFIQAGAASSSTLYIKQGGVPIDTITVTNHKIKKFYVYDGTLFQAYPK
jgi:hypothetical protein